MVKKRVKASYRKKKNSSMTFLIIVIIVLLSGALVYTLMGKSNQSQVLPPAGFKYDPSAQLLIQNGKIVVVYVGAEWCPYCAAEKWALVDALSNFGTWSNLQSTYTAPESIEPQLPNIPTFTFVNASYHSDYVIFMPVELQDRYGKPLQEMNQIQRELINKYDPQISIPFISIGGVYYRIGSNVNPTLLKGLTFEQVKEAIASKNGPIYQAVHEESQAIITLINSLRKEASAFLYPPYYLVDLLLMTSQILSILKTMSIMNPKSVKRYVLLRKTYTLNMAFSSP